MKYTVTLRDVHTYHVEAEQFPTKEEFARRLASYLEREGQGELVRILVEQQIAPSEGTFSIEVEEVQ